MKINLNDLWKFLAGAFFVSAGVIAYLAWNHVSVPFFGQDYDFLVSPTRSLIHFVLFIVFFYLGFVKKSRSAYAKIAVSFLQMASSGNVREAYEKYVHPDFTHHNPYFPGDRESLRKAMEESTVNFPNKDFRVLRTVERGDLTVVHGRIKVSPEVPEMVLIHIFRFADGKIIEEWEAAQQVPDETVNENGMF